MNFIRSISLKKSVWAIGSRRQIYQQHNVKRFDSIVVVPHDSVFLVERFGKYSRTLNPGRHLLIPFVERVTHAFSLREHVVNIPAHTAVTMDKTFIHVETLLFVKVIDPRLAAYATQQDLLYNVVGRAQSVMAAQMGRFKIYEIIEHIHLIDDLVAGLLNDDIKEWGIQCCSCHVVKFAKKEKAKAEEKEMRAEAQGKMSGEILQSKDGFEPNPKETAWDIAWDTTVNKIFKPFLSAIGALFPQNGDFFPPFGDEFGEEEKSDDKEHIKEKKDEPKEED